MANLLTSTFHRRSAATCNFYSCIVKKDGEILACPEATDSHTDLIEFFGLAEKGIQGTRDWVRVEFTPKGGDHSDVESYVLHVDEDTAPEWWTVAFSEDVATRLRLRIEKMIVSEPRKCLVGGPWILTEGADIGRCQNVRIVSMRGSSKVGVMWGSSNVGEMRGSSNVGEMWGSSNVGVMWGSSNVGEMWGSSSVGVMRGSSNVGEMWESSNVGETGPDATHPRKAKEDVPTS